VKRMEIYTVYVTVCVMSQALAEVSVYLFQCWYLQ